MSDLPSASRHPLHGQRLTTANLLQVEELETARAVDDLARARTTNVLHDLVTEFLSSNPEQQRDMFRALGPEGQRNVTSVLSAFGMDEEGPPPPISNIDQSAGSVVHHPTGRSSPLQRIEVTNVRLRVCVCL
jgi:hypothetical protein